MPSPTPKLFNDKEVSPEVHSFVTIPLETQHEPQASPFQCLEEPSYVEIFKESFTERCKYRNRHPKKIFWSKQIGYIRWRSILLEGYQILKKKGWKRLVGHSACKIMTMCLCGSSCLPIIWCWKMFVGVITSKPSRDFTRPLGMPRDLKGLLHMLNAIVSPTTYPTSKNQTNISYANVVPLIEHIHYPNILAVMLDDVHALIKVWCLTLPVYGDGDVLICILTPLIKLWWLWSHQNSAVKRASTRVVPGWVTSWEVWFKGAKSGLYCVSLGWGVTQRTSSSLFVTREIVLAFLEHFANLAPLFGQIILRCSDCLHPSIQDFPS